MRRTSIVTPRLSLSAVALAALLLPFGNLLLPFAARAQSSSISSSSSSSPTPSTQQQPDNNPAARPRAAQIEEGGAAVTLETNEPLCKCIFSQPVC